MCSGKTSFRRLKRRSTSDYPIPVTLMAEWKVTEFYEPSPGEDNAEAQESEGKSLTITQWAEDDRPREKLAAHGADALSAAELLAILIGSGNQRETAVDLMKRILGDCDNRIATLSRMSLDELMRYNGIGEAKAVTILAACELGKRREREDKPVRTVLGDPAALYEHLHLRIRDLDVEEAYVVLMNQSFKHIRTVRMSHGGLTETAVDVRLIIKEALQANATVIALAHNHPSGSVRPSREDDAVTKKVADACALMRIHFLDHLILADGDYYSYREEGKI